MSLEREIEKIVESLGAKLYDIESVSENGKNIYRIIITANKGVDVDLCAKVSNIISPLLDVNPPMAGSYSLEVSSPGIERKLKKPKHFQNSIGEFVRVVLNDGSQIEGELKDFKDNRLFVETNEKIVEVDLDKITSAKTFYRW